MKSTKELKDLLALILKGVDVGVAANKDKHIGVEDLGSLLTLVPLIQPAIEGLGEIPEELADLDADEIADVVAFVMTTLAVEDAKARSVIEAGLKVIAAVYTLVKAVKA